METMMKTTKTTATPVLLCLLLSVGGCFSLSKGAPAPKHYVLGSGDAVMTAESGARAAVGEESESTPVIGLRSPELADYLASSYIVVRRGDHQVGFSEFDRWGEQLERGFNRALAGRMAGRTSTHRVVAAPWSATTPVERVVQVELLRFEGVAPTDTLATVGEAHLLARWEILAPRDGARLAAGTTEVRSPGWTVGDYAELVGLLDAALDALAEDLVREFARLPPPPEGIGTPRKDEVAGTSCVPPSCYIDRTGFRPLSSYETVGARQVRSRIGTIGWPDFTAPTPTPSNYGAFR